MAARQMNPYRPGFAQHPLLLAGRGAVVAGAREALEVAALDGRMPRPLVLVGVRGVGKTVALNEIAALAADGYSWPTVHVEVKPRTSFTAELVERLTAVRSLFTQTPEGGARFRVQEGKLKAVRSGSEARSVSPATRPRRSRRMRWRLRCGSPARPLWRRTPDSC